MRTEQYYVKILETAMEDGEYRRSNLIQHHRLQALYGLTGVKTRHMLQSLLSNGKLTYLELGVFRGASLAAALWNNPNVVAYGVDDWHYSTTDTPETKRDEKGKVIPWPNVQLAAEDVVAKYGLTNVKLISKNWLELTKTDIPEPIDIVHIQPDPGIEEKDLRNILDHIYPFLGSTSIVLAELYKLDVVRNAYESWVKDKKLHIDSIHIKDSSNLYDSKFWWGGLGAMVLTKKDITK